MTLSVLTALSPLDGRYHSKVDALRSHFSEFGLIRYRVLIEIEWLKALSQESGIKESRRFLRRLSRSWTSLPRSSARPMPSRSS